jgi:hypothetical protein
MARASYFRAGPKQPRETLIKAVDFVVAPVYNKKAFAPGRMPMTTVTTEVIINNDRKINLELPPDTPVGPAMITLTFEPGTAEAQPRNQAAEVYGQGRGQVWMAEDFDAPLADFAEYM